MLRGKKPESEVRFELFTWGMILVTAAVIYLTVYSILPGLILFIPGLILLGSAIFQDMQPDWRVGWLTYIVAILVVATGMAWVMNSLVGTQMRLPWLVIAAIELGLVLIVKALYDLSSRRTASAGQSARRTA